ncbi:helix-turn-helix domain-containing protein [Sphingomonas sp. AR_OL41]|uniref:helix-turn-helix domain-containing protein n=1 Tax=Sphingomonas sp. AR_OL41 TaxID=3042729 RepID=UPI0024801667|nr:helix-turn-helix domain-containing protein [Sphingomonas sp. AR_OL41]MDH7976061.1 helix-turn-helix domain-containing protein [Sphingomonas sp. AR_OL41]
MSPGRPTSYAPSFAGIAERLCRNGATDPEVAEILGICVRTLYRWRNEHEAFALALRAGKELADDRVERALYQRAVGYTATAQKVVTRRGHDEPVVVSYEVHIPADVRAALHWLAVRRPTPWARPADEEPKIDIAAIVAERRAYVIAQNDARRRELASQEVDAGVPPCLRAQPYGAADDP